MSRVTEAISSVQFQADARPASASIDALKKKVESLNADIEETKAKLEKRVELGLTDADVAGFEKKIKNTLSEIKDLERGIKDLAKGAKAADELWKHALAGDIESMSMKQIKAGQNGLRARMQNLTPGNAEDQKKMRAFESIINEADAVMKAFTADAQYMVKTMKEGGVVSEAALAKTKNGLRELISMTPRGTEEARKYTEQLKELNRLGNMQVKNAYAPQAAALKGDLGKMSPQSIRESIDAAKKLLDVYGTGSTKAKSLANDIANAEKHLKNTGVEAARAAQKQAEAIELQKRKERELQSLMVGRMKTLKTISADALAETQKYWQAQVNGADASDKRLSQYQSKLAKINAEMQRRQMAAVTDSGKSALSFFRSGGADTASADAVKQQAAALKKYRDSLPQQANASLIAEIDQLLMKAGQSAQRAGEQAMTLKEALTISGQVGAGTFKGTTQQLQNAKKAMEDQLKVVEKGGAEWRKLKDGIDTVNRELKRTDYLSKEVQAILDRPKGRSFNDLKMAVEQARAKLASMSTTTEKQRKEFDELAKKVKEADFQMKSLGQSSKGSANSFDKAWSRLRTYITLYMGSAIAIQKLVSAIGELGTLSDKMGEVRKTTGFTADEVGRLSDNLTKLDTRTSLTSLMELSAKAGQLGLKTEEEVIGFTEAANKMIVALPEMGAEGATEMLKVATATGEVDKIRQQLADGTIKGNDAVSVAMEKIASTIDQLRANSAAAAPQITDFIKRVGAVGAQSGISIDQVAALGATVDALGMRVEMSATAISRMIPAFKNHAFELGQILQVPPDTIRSLFDTGHGMEAILMMLQHIKDSGKDADSIEAMLGTAGMQSVMKELNQQGARAGIVFAGLSQNVDVLRQQLNTAADAYEKNIAIQQEYDKMNDTLAGKWARLQNEIQEMFVNDSAQRFFGHIVDGIRSVVDLISSMKGPLSVLITMLAAYRLGLGEAMKALALYLSNLKFGIKDIKASISKLSAANIWGAAITGAIALSLYIEELVKKMNEAAIEAAKYEAQLQKQQIKVNELADSIGAATGRVDEANAKQKEAEEALEKARKAVDGSRESMERLTTAERNKLLADEELRKAEAARTKLIRSFNTDYGKYLGYMLSEVSSELELAKARELANQKLREGMVLKKKEAGIVRIEQENGGGRDKWYAKLKESIEGGTWSKDKNGKWQLDYVKANRIMNEVMTLAGQSKDEQDFMAQMENMPKKYGLRMIDNNWKSQALEYFTTVKDIEKKTNDVITQFDHEIASERQETQKDLKASFNAAIANSNTLTKRLNDAKADLNKLGKNADAKTRQAAEDRVKQAAADLLKEQDSINEMVDNAENHFDLMDENEKASYRKFMDDSEKRYGAARRQREKLLKMAGDKYEKRTTVGGGSTDNKIPGAGGSVWGKNTDATSTAYGEWNVEELVERRKQMNKFKNALEEGIDVKKVLAEDKALMKAIEEGKVGTDWKEVKKWYDAERKKIQEELKSERFSTNTGNWRDEKDGKKKKRVNDFYETDYALAELDRYYANRKELLEKARTEENMSEELYNRIAESLEQEHLERRSTLRTTFTKNETKEEKKRVKEFRTWWEALVESNELDVVEWNTVENEWKRADNRQIGNNNKKAQTDLTKLQELVVKHANAIDKIIAKERPYDGITTNLQENLVKSDILLKDLMGNGATPTELVAQMRERTAFLMKEAENAYTLSAEQLREDMKAAGLGAWGLAMTDDDVQHLLAQVRTVYDSVMDAVKKEAAQLKKQVDIIWNDTSLTGTGRSAKGLFDAALIDMGQKKDATDRANSLIGAGTASQNVATKMAIKQLELQIRMEQTRYAMMRKQGLDEIERLKQKGQLEDAANLKRSLDLALTEELAGTEEKRVEIAKQTEEAQNRTYQTLKEWASLFYSGIQNVMEAGNSGLGNYYDEMAKLQLTGSNGQGGQYIIIDDAGTEDAKAHYETLSDEEYLKRSLEIEQQNAVADAWKQLMDDMNMKIAEQITDFANAAMQNAAMDSNTDATQKNTDAINTLTQSLSGFFYGEGEGAAPAIGTPEIVAGAPVATPGTRTDGGEGGGTPTLTPLPMTDDDVTRVTENTQKIWTAYAEQGLTSMQEMNDMMAENGLTAPLAPMTEEQAQTAIDNTNALADAKIDASNLATQTEIANNNKKLESDKKTDTEATKSAQSASAKMVAACNLYGLAYSTMCNDNMSASEKFQLFAIQAAGNAAITMLTTDLVTQQGKTAVQLPGILGKAVNELGVVAGPIAYAAISALLGGLMGVAVSSITKSKSQIAQATGVSASAGRLSTGMLTYAEGNVDEFTDPDTLTVGRRYNVDAADGKTYRARYMGRNVRTHITNGPEFHLSGEKGREAIIDAHTTRRIQTDDAGIWRTIQTLSAGRHSAAPMRRRRGVTAFAEGNVDELTEMMDGESIDTEAMSAASGLMTAEQAATLQASIENQNALLAELRQNGIKAYFDVYGRGGLIDSYDRGKKTVKSHGVNY